MTRYQRFTASLSPAAMIMAILALVVAAAGVGVAAATIGTSDIKNNAVTTAKVKNGTLKARDMVKEKKFTFVDAPGRPNFSNGGQGDCLWQSAHVVAAGLPRVGFRTDRFATTHLTGLAAPSDASGGDGVCDTSTESEDGLAFTLPATARPRKHVLLVIGDNASGGGTLVVAGRGGLATGSTFIPAGGVYWTGTGIAPLDNISFPASNTRVYGRSTAPAKITPQGKAWLRSLGIR